MSNAFAAAASVLAADPNLGADALYTPQDEAPLAIRVVLTREEAPVGPGYGMVASGHYAMIAVGAIPDRPLRGELLSVGTQDFTIETAELDETQASWRVQLRKA